MKEETTVVYAPNMEGTCSFCECGAEFSIFEDYTTLNACIEHAHVYYRKEAAAAIRENIINAWNALNAIM